MTSARSFTANPVVVKLGLELTFDGVKTSALVAALDDPDRATEITENGKWAETFRSVAALPGAVTDHIMESVTVQENGSMKIHQAASVPILRQIIRPEDQARFDALLNDAERVVDLATLWQAAAWAVEELGGRPTGGSGA